MQKERNKKKCSDKYKTQTAENKLLSEIDKTRFAFRRGILKTKEDRSKVNDTCIER